MEARRIVDLGEHAAMNLVAMATNEVHRHAMVSVCRIPQQDGGAYRGWAWAVSCHYCGRMAFASPEGTSSSGLHVICDQI